jgi:hypothetical protein
LNLQKYRDSRLVVNERAKNNSQTHFGNMHFIQMVEVFKTNVSNREEASNLVNDIHKRFCSYSANFDLEDCDKILRIECANGNVEPKPIIDMLTDAGYQVEVLAG